MPMALGQKGINLGGEKKVRLDTEVRCLSPSISEQSNEGLSKCLWGQQVEGTQSLGRKGNKGEGPVPVTKNENVTHPDL